MATTMTCFVMHGVGRVGLVEKPVPRAGPNDAVVRTTAALVCTSDCHTVAGALGDRHGLTLGHGAVGVVHELGEVAEAGGRFKLGQRVAVSAITPCYARADCRRGDPSRCGGRLGGWKFANLKDGSFAEYFYVNDAVANLAPIPDGLIDERATYCCDTLSAGLVAGVESVPNRVAHSPKCGRDAVVDFANRATRKTGPRPPPAERPPRVAAARHGPRSVPA